jgi:hypothetical protein
MAPTKDERLKGTRLVQACRCGEALVATRFAFAEHAERHFKECKALKSVTKAGPTVRANWYEWEPVQESWIHEADSFTPILATYVFQAPLFIHGSGGVVQGQMIETAIADVRQALVEGGSLPPHSIPVLHAALLRMIEHPRAQQGIRTLLALRDESSVMARREAVIELLHRVALGHYG